MKAEKTVTETRTSDQYRKKLKISLCKMVHVLLSIAIFAVAWFYFRYHLVFDPTVRGFRYNYFIIAAYAAILFFFNRTYSAYLLGYVRIRNLAFAQFLSQIFSAGVVYVLVCIGWDHFVNPLPLIVSLIPAAVLDVAWSYYANLVYFHIYPPKKTILIYRNELDKKRFGSIKGKPTERLYKITEEFCYDGYSFKAIRNRLQGYEAVFAAGVHSRCRNGIAKYCKEEGIPGFFLPHVGDVIMHEAEHIKSFDSPVLLVERKVLNPEYAVAKRALDILASGIALIILSPVLLITALVIHFYDGGPALYKQTRLTQNGREFKILKFRSMRVDAEKDGVARLSSGENDDRITPVGRVIRKCRLDELPQLWNIFVGDMSLVGPRPERPEIAEQYYQYMPDFKLRLQVRAGLTGYAQVYGKYNTDPYEKLEFDLLYIGNMNFLTDLQLIFATFGILFSKESTEGVAANQVTAIDYDNEAYRAYDPPPAIPADKAAHWAD